MKLRKETAVAITLFLGVWPRTQPAMASVPSSFRLCRSLDACLRSLDPVAFKADGSIGPDDEAFTRKLRTFGEPAKHELLQRAAGDDAGWRNLSQAILENWKTWTPSDVPALRSALQKEPGGWMARPLKQIGTPAAIQALVEDLPKESDSQTDFALVSLGAKAIPFLMPLLEAEKTSQAASMVIEKMGDAAIPFAQAWSEQAGDSAEPLNKRLAALKAIGALGNKARPVSAGLKPLLSSSHAEIREQAALTIEAVESFSQGGPVGSDVSDVSLIELIANPLRYDGKRIQVIGFLRLEFEGDALYLHREDFENAISQNAIWFDRPRDLSKKQAEAVNTKYAICGGIFKAHAHGHMGLFSGTLTGITRVEPWGFSPQNQVPSSNHTR